MKASFCTTCHNRLWQLKQTLGHNLSYMKVNESELCILAYNDSEVEPYLLNNYSEYILDGRLRIITHHDNYIPMDGSDFACGYVKNLSHAMGNGEVLFNLDADNFICNWYDYILNLQYGDLLIHQGFSDDGRNGRIAIHSALFKQVGGYRDVGRRDDGDFITRCIQNGLRIRYLPCDILPIKNQMVH